MNNSHEKALSNTENISSFGEERENTTTQRVQSYASRCHYGAGAELRLPDGKYG